MCRFGSSPSRGAMPYWDSQMNKDWVTTSRREKHRRQDMLGGWPRCSHPYWKCSGNLQLPHLYAPTYNFWVWREDFITAAWWQTFCHPQRLRAKSSVFLEAGEEQAPASLHCFLMFPPVLMKRVRSYADCAFSILFPMTSRMRGADWGHMARKLGVYKLGMLHETKHIRKNSASLWII